MIATPTDTIALDPFTVTTTTDVGYQAHNSLSGSRINTSLKDIAAPTTAFTEEFLRDAAITSTDDLAKFMLSTEYDFGEDAGGQNRLQGDSRGLRVRGLPGGTTSVNFFKTDLRADTFSAERLDQSRGPNSVLFGIGTPGGLINVSTKRAQWNKPRYAFTLRGQSENGLRTEIDANQPLIPNRLTLRFAAVDDRKNNWRNYEYDDQQRLFLTGKFKVTPKTELNIETERGKVDKSTKRTYTAFDSYTTWAAAGRVVSATPNAALGIQRLTTAPYIVYDTGGALINWRNATVSARRLTPDGANFALSDFSQVSPETVIYGPGYYQTTDYARTSAFLTHTFTPKLNAEMAVFRSDVLREVADPPQNLASFIQYDTNPTLPNGQLNPNQGKAYLEGYPHLAINDGRDESARITLSFDQYMGKFFGRHRLAGVYQYNRAKGRSYILREHIVRNPLTATQPENGNNRVWRRTYIDLNGLSENKVMADWRQASISGRRELVGGQELETAFIPFNPNTAITSSQSESLVGMVQSNFWQNRIYTLLGFSRDTQEDLRSTQVRTAPVAPFTSGVLYAVPGTDSAKNSANNVSFSAVWHAVKWLSLTYNQARNSALPNLGGQLNTVTGRPPAPRGESRDIGFKLDLFERRLFLTATYFETSAKKDFDFTGVLAATINPVWSALDAAGLLAQNGQTLFDVQDRTTGSTFDSVTDGVELELTANPTERWRVFLNYSNSETRRTQIGQEMRAAIEANRAFWLAGDRGRILLDGSGGLAPVASDNDGIVETIAEQVQVIDRAIVDQFVLPDGKRPLGQARQKFNFRTAYDFSRGRLKGITAGGGLRYQRGVIVAYTSALDAAGAIVRTKRIADPQAFVDLNLGYRFRFKPFGRAVDWSLQLNVNNALDNRDLIPTRELTTGEIVNYRFNPPREWVLTSRFVF